MYCLTVECCWKSLSDQTFFCCWKTLGDQTLAVAGSRLATRLWQLLEAAWRPDFDSCWKPLGDQTFCCCWKTLGDQTLAVAGSCLATRLFCCCWKLLQWSYDQTSVVPLSPSATKNSPHPARPKNPPTPQTHQLRRTKKANNRTGCNSLGQDKLQHPKGKNDSTRREREPRKSHKTSHLGQVQHAHRSLTSCCAEIGKPHWCCCHSKTKVERKEAVLSVNL